MPGHKQVLTESERSIYMRWGKGEIREDFPQCWQEGNLKNMVEYKKEGHFR